MGGKPAKRVAGPRYKLADICPLAKLASVSRDRATRKVGDRLGIDDPQAEAFCRGKVATLVPGAYVHTVEFSDGRIVCDVYAVRDKHGGWYVKFYQQHGRLVITSCHEPEEGDLTRNDGEVIKGR